MASLVSWLAYSGARKSDGSVVSTGTAWFYEPGTTNTLVTVYSDADGLVPQANPVTLDAAGRCIAYLKAAARIEIYDSASALVETEQRSNTISSPQVEIENNAFTGVSLTTGSTTAGGRTDLNTAWDRLLESFGTTNFQVLKTGTTTPVNLKDAFSGIASSVFYNVKDAPYSAVANGTADDTTPIQDAIDACAAAGGGVVWFPTGTYKITSALTLTNNKVSLWGPNARAAVIKQATNTAEVLTVNLGSASNGGQFIMGLGFDHSLNATNGVSFSSTSSGMKMLGCRVTARFTNGVSDASLNGIYAQDCIFEIRGAGSCCGINASNTVVKDSFFLFPTQNANSVFGVLINQSIVADGWRVLVDGCTFDGSSLGGTATGSCVFSGVESYQTLIANRMTGGGTLLKLIGGNTGFAVTESGTVIIDPTNGPNLWNTTGLTFKAPASDIVVNSWVSTRENGISSSSVNGTSYTPNTMEFGVHMITHTGGAAFAFANAATLNLYRGARLLFFYKNTSGGAITCTFGTQYKVPTVPSVGNGEAAAFPFVFDGTNWCYIGGAASKYTY